MPGDRRSARGELSQKKKRKSWKTKPKHTLRKDRTDGPSDGDRGQDGLSPIITSGRAVGGAQRGTTGKEELGGNKTENDVLIQKNST